MHIKVKGTSETLMIAIVSRYFNGPCVYKIKEIYILAYKHPVQIA